MKRIFNDALSAVLLFAILLCAAVIAKGQACTLITQGYVGSAAPVGPGSVNLRWLSRTPTSQIKQFQVVAPWAINQPPAGYFDAGTAFNFTVQYICPINGGSVTIREVRTNGSVCEASYSGNQPHGGCGNGNTAGLSTRNGANFGPFLAPDAIGAAFGDSDFTTVTAVSYDADPLTPGYQLPMELGGVRLLIGGQAVGLFFVSPKQINFHVPANLPLGLHAVQAITPDGRAMYGDVYLAKNQPGIFTLEANGTGRASYYWWIFRQGLPYRILTPDQLQRGDLQAGDRVFAILFGTGVNSPRAELRLGNGRAYSSLYAGDSPLFVGLDQLNFEIPLADLWLGSLGASIIVFDEFGASWNSNGFTLQGLRQ